MKITETYNEKIFEDIKHIDEDGNEYWYARELQKALNYVDWRNFKKTIDKAIVSAKNAISDKKVWVVEFNRPIKTGKGKEEIIVDYKLPRYICYLIVQNSDPSKKVVALGQAYFTIKTRKQELTEKEYQKLSEEDKRLYDRNLIKKGNYSLNKTAQKSGVKNFDKFHNAGYKGLYNGETADDIAKRKGLRYREDILDNMGSEELIANLFRISQTDAKLKRDNVKTESVANETHYDVGKTIRDTIKKLGGTMPENLPTPEKSLKELEKGKKLKEKFE